MILSLTLVRRVTSFDLGEKMLTSALLQEPGSSPQHQIVKVGENADFRANLLQQFCLISPTSI